MTKLLIKLFVANKDRVDNDAVRTSYGTLSAVVGIICNIILGVGKVLVGVMFGLISVLADGVNNITDCGNNIVSIITFRIASKPADEQHPYGHQRIEYVGSLIVGLVVVVIALQLAIESVGKIISPATTVFSWVTVVVLGVSILVKLWMYMFNRTIALTIDSSLIQATAIDSLSDMLATAGVLVAIVLGEIFAFNIDGYIGCAVSIIILIAGINILRDTMNDILGKAPDDKLVQSIKDRIMNFGHVHSIHDMEVHSYGSNKYFATVHVEIDANMDSLAMHDIADRIERDFANNTNISLVVHSDPVVLDNDKLNGFKHMISCMVSAVDEHAHAHDIRMVEGVNFTNIIFDVAVPFDCKYSDQQIVDMLKSNMADLDDSVYLVVTVEHQHTT